MAIAAAATFALLALPSPAAAETVVPPGNSAATQYTETFPTAGGNAEVNSSIGAGGGSPHGGGRSPSKVLGSHTAQQLESHGQEGRTVATLATESAPAGEEEGGGNGGASGGGGKGGGPAGGHRSPGTANGAGQGGPGSAEGAGSSALSEAPAGSSGFSEVLSHATGSSSGEMGIFLPLVLLAAPLCALAYAWRRRQPGRAAP